MGDKYFVSIRFHTEGMEANLYRRIQAEKENAGVSMPEYVKNILSEYFKNMEKRNETGQTLQEIRVGYRDLIGRVERTIRQSVRGQDAILIGALGKMGWSVMPTDNREVDAAELLEESGEIPENALDFLGEYYRKSRDGRKIYVATDL